MSNPLLRPNDPRFQQPDMRDAQGKNQFAESADELVDASAADEVYAAAAETGERPYEPKYEVQQRSRAGLLLFLGGIAWAAAVVGAVSLASVFKIGWVGPLLGVFPGGAAWFLAHEELRSIRMGAIDANADTPARHAFWLGLTGLLACLGIVVSMVYRRMNFLPDL